MGKSTRHTMVERNTASSAIVFVRGGYATRSAAAENARGVPHAVAAALHVVAEKRGAGRPTALQCPDDCRQLWTHSTAASTRFWPGQLSAQHLSRHLGRRAVGRRCAGIAMPRSDAPAAECRPDIGPGSGPLPTGREAAGRRCWPAFPGGSARRKSSVRWVSVPGRKRRESPPSAPACTKGYR